MLKHSFSPFHFVLSTTFINSIVSFGFPSLVKRFKYASTASTSSTPSSSGFSLIDSFSPPIPLRNLLRPITHYNPPILLTLRIFHIVWKDTETDEALWWVNRL